MYAHSCSHLLAGRAHKRPVASETLLDGTCQGSDGGSHGGGGLLEVGGAIQGGSTLEVMLLSSLITEMANRKE